MNTGEKTNADYGNLIIRFLNGEASAKEINLLRLWINQSAENKEEFIQSKISWMATAQVQDNKQVDVQEDLLRLNRKIKEREKVNSAGFHNRLKYISGIAAAIIIFILIGSAGTYLILKSKITGSVISDNLIHVYAPKGSRAVTILPDGTKVWLNAGTDIMYDNKQYGRDQRQVTIIGEGFFKVAKNPDKPFIVNAKNLKIEALGTEFNVKAYPEEDNIETTLVKGIVKVDGKDQNSRSFSITLKPNQQVKFRAGKAAINSVV
ncbi:MAG: FecR domain-containing protein, partial [Bacteroidales bacterium]